MAATNDSADGRLKYVSEWFYFHADQRLRAFNFYLVVVAGLGAAVGQSVPHRLRILSMGVGVVGALAAATFLALEVRNHTLIELARTDLIALEKNLGVELMSRSRGQHSLTHHKFWIRLFIVATGISFGLLTGWAAINFPGA